MYSAESVKRTFFLFLTRYASLCIDTFVYGFIAFYCLQNVCTFLCSCRRSNDSLFQHIHTRAHTVTTKSVAKLKKATQFELRCNSRSFTHTTVAASGRNFFFFLFCLLPSPQPHTHSDTNTLLLSMHRILYLIFIQYFFSTHTSHSFAYILLQASAALTFRLTNNSA